MHRDFLTQRALFPFLEVTYEAEPTATLGLRKHLHILIGYQGFEAEHLNERTSLFTKMQASLYHSGIIEHHKRSRRQMFGKRSERVFTHLTTTIEQ